MRRPLLLALSLLVTVAALPAAAVPEVDRRPPVHTVGGCALFPADNPWNRRIDDRPVWRWSKAIVGKQAAGHDLHLDLGEGLGEAGRVGFSHGSTSLGTGTSR
jgi:hypothetical protein